MNETLEKIFHERGIKIEKCLKLYLLLVQVQV